jgi:hypothetical protein
LRPGGLQRNPVADLEAVAVGGRLADDDALPVVEPGLLLGLRELQLGVHREVFLGHHRELADTLEVLARVLVDRAEPAGVGHRLHPGTCSMRARVSERQGLDDAHLVERQQAVLAGDLDAEGERRTDRREISEEHEGDADREQREQRAQPLAPEVAEQERQEFAHAAASATS